MKRARDDLGNRFLHMTHIRVGMCFVVLLSILFVCAIRPRYSAVAFF